MKIEEGDLLICIKNWYRDYKPYDGKLTIGNIYKVISTKSGLGLRYLWSCMLK